MMESDEEAWHGEWDEMTLQEKLAILPDRPGSYLMKNAAGEILYVGKAVSLRNRVRSYFHASADHTPKVRRLVSEIADIDWIITDTELEALILECNLIKKYRPRFNVRLRDDKHYPYICVTLTEKYPRLMLVREAKKDGNRYFGPYTDARAVRQSIALLSRIFRLRSCHHQVTGNEPEKLCLYYHINECSGPCAGKISQEEYRETVEEACLFLEGRQDALLKQLRQEMERSAERLNFERAARLRDQIKALETIRERQKVLSTALVDQDVVALVSDDGQACAQLLFMRNGRLVGQEHFYLEGTTDEELSQATAEFLKQYYQDATYAPKEVLVERDIAEHDIIEAFLRQKHGKKVHITAPSRGEKKRLVEMAHTNALDALRQLKVKLDSDKARNQEALTALKEALEMERVPLRIEAYDISHIQGVETVGAMVVLYAGAPRKSDYRRFIIKSLGPNPDDFAAMKEVVGRRLARGKMGDEKFREMPDLLLIDGGKGQLNAALEAMREMEVEIPAVGLAKQFEEIFLPGQPEALRLPRHSPALHLLQRVRDEAHRFAISYHRKRRSRRSTRSLLDSVPGIGPKRKRELLRHFGSLARIRQATLEELAACPGMNQRAAEALYHSLCTAGTETAAADA
ncbi:MAG TPA: excinuclease ABC subunit UvrC [Armatimonadota bacterium]|nr:excinuclease ABC subunit UvrC [Armatimonadota bacterium]HPT98282.1 excinuclease ABC subunit UvrC [Armatimonadota bacterium]